MPRHTVQKDKARQGVLTSHLKRLLAASLSGSSGGSASSATGSSRCCSMLKNSTVSGHLLKFSWPAIAPFGNGSMLTMGCLSCYTMPLLHNRIPRACAGYANCSLTLQRLDMCLQAFYILCLSECLGVSAIAAPYLCDETGYCWNIRATCSELAEHDFNV